jgi:hypothetical protein
MRWKSERVSLKALHPFVIRVAIADFAGRRVRDACFCEPRKRQILAGNLGGPLLRCGQRHSYLAALGKLARPLLTNVWEKREAAMKIAQELAATSHLIEVSTPIASSKPMRNCG